MSKIKATMFALGNLLLPVTLASALASFKRQVSNITQPPLCFYDYPCPSIECYTSINPTTCQQSIHAVCSALAASQPNSKYLQFFYYSTNNGSRTSQISFYYKQDPKLDCVAMINISNKLTEIPSEESCLQAFYGILGCAHSTNVHYNDSCVGGSVNVNPCGSEGSNPDVFIDVKMPQYNLGTPATLSYSVSSTHTLGRDTEMEAEHQFYLDKDG